MKEKFSVFLSIFLLFSGGAYAQQTEPAKPASKPAETKSTPSSVKLPSAKEILDKYVQAIGGRAAHEKIKTRVTKTTAELKPMGIKGTSETVQSAPDKSRSTTTFAGIGEIVQSFDGKTGWTINPLQGNRDLSGDEIAQSRLLYNLQREVNLDRLFPKMEVKGIEKVGDRDAYVVVGTPVGLDPWTFYFDAQSGLLLRTDSILVSPEGKQPVKSFYEDYREIDGIKLPFKSRAVTPQIEIVTVITEIKHNVAVEDNSFVKPK